MTKQVLLLQMLTMFLGYIQFPLEYIALPLKISRFKTHFKINPTKHPHVRNIHIQQKYPDSTLQTHKNIQIQAKKYHELQLYNQTHKKFRFKQKISNKWTYIHSVKKWNTLSDPFKQTLNGCEALDWNGFGINLWNFKWWK